VRIKTCVEDTVIIVLTRSSTQLHGNVLEEEDKSKHDKTAWTTRVIPYVQKGVYGWRKRTQLSRLSQQYHKREHNTAR